MAKLSERIIQGQVTLGDLTQKTNWVDNSVVSVTGHDGSVTSANFRVHKDTNDQYHLEFNVHVEGITSSSFHVLTLGLGGATFPSGQALTQSVQPNGGIAAATVSTANIRQDTTSATTAAQMAGIALLSGKPSWFDANAVNKTSISAQVDEATSTVAGLVKKNRIKTKSSTGVDHTTSGTISGLTFNNLTIGQVYRASFRPFLADTSTGVITIAADIKNGATTVGNFQYRGDTEAQGRYMWSVTHQFTATSTSVTVEYTATASVYFVSGQTQLTLEELQNTLDAGTDWD